MYEHGAPKVDEAGNPILEKGPDFESLQHLLKVDEETIKKVLIAAHVKGYTTFINVMPWGGDSAFGSLIVSGTGRSYISNIDEERAEIRRRWTMTIVTGLVLPIMVGWLTSKYFTKTEIKLLQSQIIQIQNQIEGIPPSLS